MARSRSSPGGRSVLEAALGALPVPAYTNDIDGFVTWQNDAALAVAGDLRGVHYSKAVPAQELARARETWAAVTLGGETRRRTGHFRASERRPGSPRGHHCPDPHGGGNRRHLRDRDPGRRTARQTAGDRAVFVPARRASPPRPGQEHQRDRRRAAPGAGYRAQSRPELAKGARGAHAARGGAHRPPPRSRLTGSGRD